MMGLDLSVAKLTGRTVVQDPMGPGIPGQWIWEEKPHTKPVYLKIGDQYSPTTKWEQGGPLIEQHRINVFYENGWKANLSGANHTFDGYTPLIAAMKALVFTRMRKDSEPTGE